MRKGKEWDRMETSHPPNLISRAGPKEALVPMQP